MSPALSRLQLRILVGWPGGTEARGSPEKETIPAVFLAGAVPNQRWIGRHQRRSLGADRLDRLLRLLPGEYLSAPAYGGVASTQFHPYRLINRSDTLLLRPVGRIRPIKRPAWCCPRALIQKHPQPHANGQPTLARLT